MRKNSLLIALLMIATVVGIGSLPIDAIARELSLKGPSAASMPAGVYLERMIPVDVTSKVTRGVIRRGDPIPLEIKVHNGFSGPIDFKSFNLKANEWNGETASVALFDIYRGRRAEGLFQGRPSINPPIAIPAMPFHRIPPGQALTITTDVSKWEVADGWLPGKYKVALRIDNIQVDGFAALSVIGEPFEFEIKN